MHIYALHTHTHTHTKNKTQTQLNTHKHIKENCIQKRENVQENAKANEFKEKLHNIC